MKRLLLIVLLLAGCVQLPPTPQDVEAKKFQAVPDKAVIYVVRAAMDSNESSGLWLDDHAQIMMHPGTYYRWEVAPGRHRVSGAGVGTEYVVLTAGAGQIYFLEHTVRGTLRSGPQVTALRQIGERDGRALVARSTLL